MAGHEKLELRRARPDLRAAEVRVVYGGNRRFPLSLAAAVPAAFWVWHQWLTWKQVPSVPLLSSGAAIALVGEVQRRWWRGRGRRLWDRSQLRKSLGHPQPDRAIELAGTLAAWKHGDGRLAPSTDAVEAWNAFSRAMVCVLYSDAERMKLELNRVPWPSLGLFLRAYEGIAEACSLYFLSGDLKAGQERLRAIPWSDRASQITPGLEAWVQMA